MSSPFKLFESVLNDDGYMLFCDFLPYDLTESRLGTVPSIGISKSLLISLSLVIVVSNSSYRKNDANERTKAMNNASATFFFRLGEDGFLGSFA